MYVNLCRSAHTNTSLCRGTQKMDQILLAYGLQETVTVLFILTGFWQQNKEKLHCIMFYQCFSLLFYQPVYLSLSFFLVIFSLFQINYLFFFLSFQSSSFSINLNIFPSLFFLFNSPSSLSVILPIFLSPFSFSIYLLLYQSYNLSYSLPFFF